MGMGMGTGIWLCCVVCCVAVLGVYNMNGFVRYTEKLEYTIFLFCEIKFSQSLSAFAVGSDFYTPPIRPKNTSKKFYVRYSFPFLVIIANM